METDPNEGRNDPMDFDDWTLGEALQDRVAALGATSDGSAGLAVDLHDLLQAAERMRAVLVPAVVDASSDESARAAASDLAFEMEHVAYHAKSAKRRLDRLAN